MKSLRFFILFMLMITVLLQGCDESTPAPIKTDDLVVPMESLNPPTNVLSVSGGTFTSFAHGLEGMAKVYTQTNGEKILRFEKFTMTAGPDVYVFFSRSNNYGAANVIALSKLTKGYSRSEERRVGKDCRS